MKAYGIETMLTAMKMFINERIITDSLYDPSVEYEFCTTENIRVFYHINSSTCVEAAIRNMYETVDVKVVIYSSTEKRYEMSFSHEEFDALINIAKLKAIV